MGCGFGLMKNGCIFVRKITNSFPGFLRDGRQITGLFADEFIHVGVVDMDVKVLGPGCPKCKLLEKATRDAIADLGLEAIVSKVEDIVEIMSYGVMSTPALVIDGKVVVKGRVPSVDEIKRLLTQ